MPVNRIRLSMLLRRLQREESRPQHIAINQFGGLYHASVQTKRPSNEHLIDYDVTGSSAETPTLAVSKALGEWIERRAFSDWSSQNPEHKADSTGFACMPTLLRTRRAAMQFAKNKAMAEAVERYVWHKWWCDPTTAWKGEKIEVSALPKFQNGFGFITSLIDLTPDPPKTIWVIRPALAGDTHSVCIVYAQLNSGGFIAGGACEPLEHAGQAFFRASAELFAHGLFAKKAIVQEFKAKDLYEDKILSFSKGEHRDLVLQRLATKGSATISLPKVAFDSEIAHGLQDIAYVHRFIFEGQPKLFEGDRSHFWY